MPVHEDEKEKVEGWRFDICEQMGFTADDAYVLAQRQDIQLREIIDLVQMKGCPPQLAVKILL